MKYDNYRNYSLADLEASKRALERDMALCCYTAEELNRELSRGRKLSFLALSCVDYLGHLESRRLDRQRQVDRLRMNPSS